MDELIKNLKRLGYLKSPRIEAALRRVDRADFVPKNLQSDAYANVPLPIGHGQTTSQPLTIVFMLELASVKKGDKVLEVGTGSGWQTVILAELVGPRGKVVSIERIEEIHSFASSNISKYDHKNIELVVGDGSKGYNKKAPYGAIIASAEAGKTPQAWKDQIETKGKIIFPINGSVCKLFKRKDGTFLEDCYPGFAFVPLVGDEK